MTLPHSLTDTEFEACKLADANSKEHFYGRALANEAFNLGYQRGRVVKPLVWHPNGTGAYFWALGSFTLSAFMRTGLMARCILALKTLTATIFRGRTQKQPVKPTTNNLY